MSSLVTPAGLLLGATEYGAYAAISRLITVAFLSDLAIRFVYAHRIGIYLVADLSSKAGFRIFSANLMHKSNQRWAARLQVVALFAMAFFVTRGLDIITSTYSSAMQAGRSQRIAFVRTADTSPGARPAVRSASILRPYNRSDVYHALRSVVKGAIDVQQPLWPRTIGSLSDAEVAALVLAQDGSMCTATHLGPAPTVLPAGSVNATSIFLERIDPLRTRAKSLFGEDVELINLRFNGNGSIDAVNRWFVFPLPISYLVGQDGQQSIAPQARQQFGVLTNQFSDLIAYDMECGLSPEQVDAWLQNKQRPRPSASSFNPQNGSTLWYADVMRADMSVDDDMQGWTAAVIMDVTKEAYNSGELELLSFGSTIRGWAYYYGMSVVPLSNLVRNSDAEADKIFPYSTLADAHPLRPAKQTGCTPVDAAYQVYLPKSNDPASGDDAKVERWISRGPPKQLGTGQQHPIRRCSVDFGLHPTNRTARVMHYYHDPANRGAQICRTKLRSSSCRLSPDLLGSRDGFVDVIAATQFSTVSQQQHAEVRCLPSPQPGKPLQPGSLPLASSRNGRWGVIVDNALQAFNKSTPEDQAGAQAWFLDVSVVPWWEIGVVAAFAVYLLTISAWDDLAEVVAIVMYAFTYQPMPPALAAAATASAASVSGETLPVNLSPRDQHLPVHLQHGVTGINLLQPITFAAVDHDGQLVAKLNDGSPAMDVRMVPMAWNVRPGDNLSLDGQGATVETVVATGAQIGEVVRTVQRTRKVQHHDI